MEELIRANTMLLKESIVNKDQIGKVGFANVGGVLGKVGLEDDKDTVFLVSCIDPRGSLGVMDQRQRDVGHGALTVLVLPEGGIPYNELAEGNAEQSGTIQRCVPEEIIVAGIAKGGEYSIVGH